MPMSEAEYRKKLANKPGFSKASAAAQKASYQQYVRNQSGGGGGGGGSSSNRSSAPSNNSTQRYETSGQAGGRNSATSTNKGTYTVNRGRNGKQQFQAQQFLVPDPWNNGKQITVEAIWDGQKWSVPTNANIYGPDGLHRLDKVQRSELANAVYAPAPNTQPSNNGGSGGGDAFNGGGFGSSSSNGGGGGSGGAFDYTDYTARIESGLNSRQDRIDDRISDNSGLVQSAQNDALTRILTGFGEQGLDGSQYQPRIESFLSDIARTIPNTDTNPSIYFNGDLTSQAINSIESQDKELYTRQLNEMFQPGFTQNYFGSGFGDADISSIINQQRSDAAQQLSNSYQRGNTSFQGYDRALTDLDTNALGARERVGDFGNGIIEGYRQQLSGVGDTARQALSTYEIGNTFDPQQFQNQLNELYGNLQGQFKGDLVNSVGNTPLFDVNTLLQTSNAAQPASNDQARAPQILASIEERKRKDQERRGLGTTGIF